MIVTHDCANVRLLINAEAIVLRLNKTRRSRWNRKLKRKPHQIYRFITNYLLWAKHYQVPNYLTTLYYGVNYFYLRSFNYALLNSAHGGRLHWNHLLNALNVHTLVHMQIGNISRVIEQL